MNGYLKGAIVTMDAGNASKKVAQKVLDAEAEYVVTIKANRKKFHTALQAFFTDAEATGFADVKVRHQKTLERGHVLRVEVARGFEKPLALDSRARVVRTEPQCGSLVAALRPIAPTARHAREFLVCDRRLQNCAGAFEDARSQKPSDRMPWPCREHVTE